MQDLPPELLNEPVAYDDNLYRVEMMVPRQKFLFIVRDRNVSVTIGKKIICSVQHHDEPPSKFSSSISVLTVYDTYGLSIAARYLKSISSGWFFQTSWYKVYLIGCMAALDLEAVVYNLAGEANILASIFSELVRRDCERYTIPLTPSNILPVEIVALITNSLRLSKKIASLVRQRRESSVPKRENLLGYYPHVTRVCCDVYWCTSSEHSTVLTRLGDKFSLNTDTSRIPFGSQERCYITATSLRTLYGYYKSLNCNPRNGLKFVLAHMKLERARTISLIYLCSIIVQLSHDMRLSESLEAMTEDELRDYLAILITKSRTYNFEQA